jgi:DNA-directed RNA polymerase specialized sigma24 family protein
MQVMDEMDDMALLREYAVRKTEAAFEELVSRRVHFVYSAALRQVGNPHLAEEITQAVFTILARKAGRISDKTILTGWLFKTTRFAVIAEMRTTAKRRQREQEAYMQSELQSTAPDPIWEQMSPLLDEALAQLGEADRQAAPVMLAKSITAAVATGATASGSTLTLIEGALKLMAWTKAKIAVVTGTSILLAVGTSTVIVKEIQKHAGSDADRIPVVMKVKWQVGNRYAMRLEITQTSESPSPKQPRPVKQSMKTMQDFSVSILKALDNDGRQLELEFGRQAMEVSQGDRRVIRFDSAQDSARDAGNPMAPLLRKIVGARIQYQVDADGKLEQVEGYQEFAKRIQTGTPEVQQFSEQMFGENTLRQYPSSIEEIMPARPVKIGDTWSRKWEKTAAAGILYVDMRFTFENWEQHGSRKCMRIKCGGNFSSKVPLRSPGATVKVERGKVSGEIWFDPDLGMVVDGVSEQNMSLKITQEGRTFAAQTTQKTLSTLVNVEEMKPQ